MKFIPFFKNHQYSFFCEKFVNLLMLDGKKLKAYKNFFYTLQFLKKKAYTDVVSPFEKKNYIENQVLEQTNMVNFVLKAIENVKPSLEVKKVRVAGSTYLVPAILPKKKQETLAMRWIIDAARKRKKNSQLSFSQCLAEEIYEASKRQGYAYQKRDELHRLAEVNRAYIRYRWW